MNIEVVEMTPERAGRLLSKNTRNRKIRPFHAKNLARQMSQGLWRQDGSPIRVSSDGVLLDGQHRLLAIIESGITVQVVLVTGLGNETMAVIDTGAVRSFADVLALNTDLKFNVAGVASIVRSVNKWRRGARAEAFIKGTGVYSRFPMDNQTLLAEFLDKPDVFIDLEARARKIRSAHRGWKLGGSVSGALAFAFDEIDRDDSREFFQKLTSGANMDMQHPIMAVIHWADAMKRDQSPLPDVWAAVLIKAWNKYRAGESWAYATYRKGGSNAEMFPEPK